MHPSPTPKQQESLRAYWLGNHNLKLPEKIPFLLEVAGNPEADGGLLVPSCCVLSPMGLSDIPPAAADYISPANIMQQLLQQLCSSRLQLWGPGQLKVLGVKDAAAGEALGMGLHHTGLLAWSFLGICILCKACLGLLRRAFL